MSMNLTATYADSYASLSSMPCTKDASFGDSCISKARSTCTSAPTAGAGCLADEVASLECLADAAATLDASHEPDCSCDVDGYDEDPDTLDIRGAKAVPLSAPLSNHTTEDDLLGLLSLVANVSLASERSVNRIAVVDDGCDGSCATAGQKRRAGDLVDSPTA